MTDFPAPFVPADCDCRGLTFMPMEVMRLRDSDLVALSTGDEFKAAVMLWAASWLQVPASSLPDDDRVLARLAGVSLADWRIVREMALHGWIKCLDGRLYHPLIADLAAKTVAKRKGQSERANSRWAKARAAKNGSGNATAMPRHDETDATVSENDAELMQGTGTVVGTEPPHKPPQGADRDEVRQAFDEWNELAERLGLPKAKTLDAGRRKAIKARLGFEGMGGWLDALAAVERSRHCRGENDRGWKADLDFVCQAKSFRRLVEGSYGADAARPVDQPPPQRPVIWNGPEEVRALVLHGLAGGGKPPSLLDTRCTWRDLPTRAIIADNPFTAADLRFNCQIDLHRAGIEIVCAESQAA